MRLYRMELHKIFHRKFVVIIGVLMLVWMGLYFSMLVSEERTTIDGIDYHGLEAIQKDREITEEYIGAFTDEKASSIIERYGFPHKVVREYGTWQDSNYLTGFVTDYLSDGYMYGWEEGEYKVAERVIPMAQSSLDIYLDDPLPFAYARGWAKLLDYLQMGAQLLCAWFIIAFSTLFSDERQLKTRALICTTEQGMLDDVRAKLGAAFTVCLTAGIALTAVSFILFLTVFGLDGSDMPAALVTHGYGFDALMRGTISRYIVSYIIILFAALIMQTAICVWISSGMRNNFQSILANITVWLLPVALFLCLRGALFRLLSGSLPFMLVMYGNMEELYHIYLHQLGLICIAVFLSILHSSRNWSRTDNE